MESTKPVLLITGVNGYIASWTAFKALETGKFKVRGSMRNKDDEKKVKLLKDALGDKFDDLELVNVDFSKEDQIKDALDGATYVFHMASPVPPNNPKNEDEVVKPAVECTEAIMRACVGSSVKKLIITSSIVCISDCSKGDIEVDESNWAEVNKNTTAYIKSKILADKASWDFMKNLPEKDKTFEMSTINPGFVVGPLLTRSTGASSTNIVNVLTGKFSMLPQIYMSIVDVRNVAEAHLKAIDAKSNERYALAADTWKFSRIGRTISEEFKQYGYKVAQKDMCKCMAWMVKFFMKDMKEIYDAWNVRCHVKNDKAKKELGIDFIDPKQSLIEMCYSLIDFGIVEDKRKK
jgi:nucleoside-diphosphate-sugar epimerase